MLRIRRINASIEIAECSKLNVFVTPEQRRRGIARMLVDATLSECQTLEVFDVPFFRHLCTIEKRSGFDWTKDRKRLMLQAERNRKGALR